MKTNKTIQLILIAVLMSIDAAAQPAMAETMRSEGKIFVVVGVVVLIFAVLFIYLISIDRKLKKLEKEKGSK